MRQSRRMLCTQWQSAFYHRAIKYFEEQGCHFSTFEGADFFSLPGWDAFFLADGPLFSAFASRWLWDRVEIKQAADRAGFSLRWVYWTPLQTLLHFFVTFLFVLSPLSPFRTFQGVLVGNLIPLTGALLSYWRLQSRLEKAGLKRLGA